MLNRLKPLSVEQAARTYAKFPEKQVYYVGTDRHGMRLFGTEGNSRLVAITEELYEKIGSPTQDNSVKASYLLEKQAELVK